jgi:hypothetical protein
MLIKRLCLGFLLCVLIASCNKDEDITFDPTAKLNYSTDSVLFDTVFTSIGSSTRRLKINNPNPKAINIDNIRLSGGANSSFSLNINGLAVNETSNLKLNGNDSINVFVKVLIDPTNHDLPFIVQDSILFSFNGKRQSIPLIAYGQNAIFIKGSTITANTTWNSKLPYLIYKSVTVAKNANLTISPGAKILFHGNATMSILGTLTAIGTKTDSIIFAGDRLEKIYKEETGQWNGLHFYPDSKNSQVSYAVIKNGITGITVDSLSTNSNPKLLLNHTIVKNMEVVGLLGYQTEITAFNNLFFNCGQYLLYGAGGGRYNLKQNTFIGYNPNFARKTSAVYLSDYISSTQSSNLTFDLYNNIIWGNLADEFLIDKKAQSSVVTGMLKNNLIKSTNNGYQANGNILNIDPMFVKKEQGNFRLHHASPAINKGFDLSADSYYTLFLQKDLDGKQRLFPSELGCYENN